MPEQEDQKEHPHKRLTKLFEYLKAFVDLRYPPVRDIEKQQRVLWLDELPDHSSVELFCARVPGEDQNDEASKVLRVVRPNLTNCPPPPPNISDWVHPGWQDLNQNIEIRETRNIPGKGGAARIERFDEDPRRPTALEEWSSERDLWIDNERPARESLRLFQTIYDWFGAIEREGERVELVLGDGLLYCPDEGGAFHHPILLQRVELEFQPGKRQPEFTFVRREQPPELYLELLRAIPAANVNQISNCSNELRQAEFDPLGNEDTEGFFRRLIQGLFPADGHFCEKHDSISTNNPCIRRRPVIFMRQRRTGTANIFDLVLEDISNRSDANEPFTTSLLQILGVFEAPKAETEASPRADTLGNEDEEVLLSKPANREQLEIARQLSRRDCVLVQGPPGTGKTHTIANLLGHLLAQGKRVLVTAHTPKALRVLREKVVDAIQPLCVSVLQNDKQSQEELQDSVRKIHLRLSSDEVQLERTTKLLVEERERILVDFRNTRARLLEARQGECRHIVFGGQGIPPIEAARIVRDGAEKDSWIPSPVTLGDALPLSVAELVALYQTNVRITLEDERELRHVRPKLQSLPSPAQFGKFVEELKTLSAKNLRLREDLWDHSQAPEDLADFDLMVERARKTIEFFRTSAAWQLEAIQAGRDGEVARRVWESLAECVENSWREIQECYGIVMEYGPCLENCGPPHEMLPVIDKVIEHLESGGKLSFFGLLKHPKWKDLIAAIRINGRPPDLTNTDHFRSAQAHLRVSHIREELTGRWQRQLVPGGGPSLGELGEKPEQVCRGYVGIIRACLDWHGSTWIPLEEDFKRLGFNWAAYLESTPPGVGENAELQRLRSAILGELEAILQARASALRVNQIRSVMGGWLEHVPARSQGRVTQRLRQALSSSDSNAYQDAYDELCRLESLEQDYAERERLLNKLGLSAPAWASALRNRSPEHTTPITPGNPTSAWRWRQLHDELERRATTSLVELQRRIEGLSNRLLKLTAELVEAKTWLSQIGSVGPEQRNALGAYTTLRGKLTKSGKGKKDADFRSAARREMAVARGAVPVWIMPLSEVVETFDPRSTRFDVVIIDEASQCDPTAMFALYLARQTVVVGDDEQVTPTAVGVDAESIMKLIRVHLEGIPHKELYDGQTSIYEFAQIAFGGMIRLVEHFRCAPDIIAFSNRLSYKGEIKPLREESAIKLRPHVIPYRVAGGELSEGSVNEVEAEVIASLICAGIEQPEFALNELGHPVSFGAVCLLGDRQALAIDRLLREHVPPEEYRRRQIICGNPSHFQGDERDVMFLSLVDSPKEGPLPMRDADAHQRLFKKRFNVAASRARDQMWVVYSLDHEVDLKSADIRRLLIEHALDPKAWVRELESRIPKTESPFEEEVLRRLLERGYNARPQYQVGAFRIDLVVSGNGKRLAVECDGERFHGPDKLQEDMDRQAILERLGWQFVRVRGSIFYRDRDRAMADVFQRLEEIGIPPELSIGTRTEEADDDPLVERIKRRAQEIRLEWSHS